jgi:hypothetical protein
MASSWEYLIRFIAKDGNTYFAELHDPRDVLNLVGSSLKSYRSFKDLTEGKNEATVTVEKVSTGLYLPGSGGLTRVTIGPKLSPLSRQDFLDCCDIYSKI